jgi:predicted nucleic acid-binding protein
LIVTDSSFLIAFYNNRDSHYPAASAAMRDLLDGKWGHGLLLEYVFLEVMTVLLARRDLSTAAHVGEVIMQARELEFVPCSDIFVETSEAFSKQSATRLSFADSAIAVVARRRSQGRVLTFDMEFRKVRGLTVLPGNAVGQ